MEKKNHAKEIAKTRANGFGGSDAAMVVAVAKKIINNTPLTITEKRRLRVIKGIDLPQVSPDNRYTLEGHNYEERVAQSLDDNWTKEALLGGVYYANFMTFAHADFYNGKEQAVIECKWSASLSHFELKEKYKYQLQWYYLCGADSVSLSTLTSKGETVEFIPMNDSLVEELKISLDVINENFDILNLEITEVSTNEELPLLDWNLKEKTNELKILENEVKELKNKLTNELKILENEIKEMLQNDFPDIYAEYIERVESLDDITIKNLKSDNKK